MRGLSMRRQRGFSIIELMISVVIMSIGVLGMVGLQMIAMQQNRSAMMQGEATLLANDILDRIRANPGTTYSSDLDATFTTTTNCEGNTCSEAEMAAYDILRWRCTINPIAADNNTQSACRSIDRAHPNEMWPDLTDTGDPHDITDVQSFMPGGVCEVGNTVCAGGSISLAGGVYTVTIQWVDQQRVDAAGSVRSISFRMREP